VAVLLSDVCEDAMKRFPHLLDISLDHVISFNGGALSVMPNINVTSDEKHSTTIYDESFGSTNAP
jgi:hypothetical protein